MNSQLFKEDNKSKLGFQLSYAHIYTHVQGDIQVEQQAILLQARAS